MQHRLPLTGTLVLVMPTVSGLVVAADRRTFDPIRGDTDSTIKIVTANQTAVFTTGVASWADAHSFRTVFDATDVAANYIREGKIRGALIPNLQDLTQRVRDGYSKHLLSIPRKFWPQDGELFQLGIVQYDETDGSLRLFLCLYEYKQEYQGESPFFEWTVKGFRYNGDLKFGMPLAFGNTSVFTELMRGKDARFDVCRRDPKIAPYMNLRKQLSLAEVSNDQAVACCRQLIKISSDKLSLVDHSDHHISPTCDVAFVGSTGFKWLYRDRE